jgi:hypothetical protein
MTEFYVKDVIIHLLKIKKMYYENEKKQKNETFSMFVFFITFIMIGFMIFFAVGFKIGSDISKKEQDTIYKKGYYFGYQHAELKYNNKKTK